jgi:hypothetical protein
VLLGVIVGVGVGWQPGISSAMTPTSFQQQLGLPTVMV